MYEESDGIYKRVRSEGRKIGYEGLFSFWKLVLIEEVGRSCNGCWYRHGWYG